SLNNGTLAVTDSFASARQIELEQTGTIAVNANTSLSLNGAITGTGSLEKTGTGTVVLAGTNTYEGGTTLHEGRVVVSQDSNLGSGALNFQGGTLATTDSFDSTRQITLNQAGHLDVAANTVLGLSGQISGSGNLIKEGAGTLRLSNTANRYGDTQILAGTLIGNASSLSGNVLNQGTLVFEQSSAGQFQGELSGAGSLLKTGAGTLVLSGQNSYTGGTTLADGRLEVSQDANLGAVSSELRFQGGALVATDSFSTAR
ncbi:autotransporter-associated beta strand repeat-containing protein, partial [Alcaligenes sp. PF14]|uniref:autotransporter-associated beta strand repeat-containing protein n=1 Tax=Alcaligenes sp. PF14 TaxID=3120297 RepID=UPI0030164E09